MWRDDRKCDMFKIFFVLVDNVQKFIKGTWDYKNQKKNKQNTMEISLINFSSYQKIKSGRKNEMQLEVRKHSYIKD